MKEKRKEYKKKVSKKKRRRVEAESNRTKPTSRHHKWAQQPIVVFLL